MQHLHPASAGRKNRSRRAGTVFVTFLAWFCPILQGRYAMVLRKLHSRRVFRWLRGVLWAAMLAACLVLPACSAPQLRGEPFPEDESAAILRKLRRSDVSDRSHAFSNKARQIDRDLGFH